MDRDREAFRERFKAYKDGKPVSEIYDAGLPRYADGKDDYEHTMNFLKKYEGFRDSAYLDGNGISTIGYGFTDSALVDRGTISRAEADARLRQEVVNRDTFLTNKIKNWDKLSEGSKTALRSYYYNYPAGFKDTTKFMKAWNAGNYREAIRQVDAGMNDKKNRGLRTRRLEEQALLKADPFLSGMPSESVIDYSLKPVSTSVKKVIPQEQAIPTYDPTINPYISGKPMLKLQPRVKLPNLIEMLEGSEWKPGFPGLKDGKLPGFKDGTRYVPDESGGWDRITNADVANTMENLVITPYGIRNKFDYEYNPNYQAPVGKQATIKPLSESLRIKQELDKINNTRTWLSDAADISHNIGEAALLVSSFAAPEVEPLVYPAYQAAKGAVVKALTSNTPAMQYLRYPIGKLIYGYDAQFPTLYRKLKTLPEEPKNGILQISNPNSRFVFESGEESPLITNFTFDAPVRKHGGGDWNEGFTLALPGRKTLLGKNVMSTEPSDLFTYGNNIVLPTKDITMISGNADELVFGSKFGLNTKTSQEIQNLYQKGFAKSPLDKNDHSEYAKLVELFARKLFGSPTKKDVDFMNFVLQPKIKGQVYSPNQLDYLIREGVEPFGDRFGNAELREYLLDNDRWANLLYDPATHAEANFRKSRGIVLKKKLKH